MKKTITLFAALAISIFVISGCAKAPAPQEAKNYAPLIPNGTMISMTYDFEKSKSGEMGAFLQTLNERILKETREFSPDNQNDFSTDIAAKIREINDLLHAELTNAKWSILNVETPNIQSSVENNDYSFPMASFVFCFKEERTLEFFENIESKIIEAGASATNMHGCCAMKTLGNEIKSSYIDISGVKVKQYKFEKESSCKLNNFEPCFGIFDGKLLIFSSSADAFKKTVDLYSGSITPMANDTKFAQNSCLENGKFANLSIDISAFFTKNVSATDNNFYLEFARNINALFYNYMLDEENSALNISLVLDSKDKEIAEKTASLINNSKTTAIMMGLPIITMHMPSLNFLSDILESLNITTEDQEIKAEVAISKSVLEKIDFKAIMQDVNKKCLAK